MNMSACVPNLAIQADRISKCLHKYNADGAAVIVFEFSASTHSLSSSSSSPSSSYSSSFVITCDVACLRQLPSPLPPAASVSFTPTELVSQQVFTVSIALALPSLTAGGKALEAGETLVLAYPGGFRPLASAAASRTVEHHTNNSSHATPPTKDKVDL